MKKIIYAVLLASTVTVAIADKIDQKDRPAIRAAGTSTNVELKGGTPADSTFAIDFAVTTGESWDLEGEAANMTDNCLSGTAVTGVEWSNLMIEVVGNSWASELNVGVYNSDKSLGAAFNFTADQNTNSGPHTQAFTDFVTDAAIANVDALVDGEFLIEIFETYEDGVGAIDSNLVSGTLTYHGNGLTRVGGGPCALPVELLNYEID